MIQKRIMIIIMLAGMVFGQKFGQIIVKPEEEKQVSDIDMTEEVLDIGSVILEQSIDQDAYLVGPGDQFLVNIQHVESVFLTLVVSPTGQLLIPNIKTIDVDGMTLRNTIKMITKSCEEAYQNASINADIVKLRHFRVSLSGAIKKPGFYTVNSATRLTDLLPISEFLPLAMDYAIKISSLDGTELIINPFEYFINGDFAQNPVLQQGDKIHIAFGTYETSGIVVRGAVLNPGYDLILPNENLENYIARSVIYQRDLDIYAVKILRHSKLRVDVMTVLPENFSKTTLLPGDHIEFLNEKPVSVIGYVGTPGSFMYIPGYTVGDYIALAGGLTSQGAFKSVKIIRSNGDIEVGKDQVVKRGDIIEVTRSNRNILLGDVSILQFVSTVATIVLAVRAIR